MKPFVLDIDTLQTIAVAVLDADGVLLEANAGFLRLLPPGLTQPIGAKVARCFIQPNFATLLAASGHGEDNGYRGLMTIGDYSGKTRSLRGRAWRGDGGMRVLAEYDIDELERLNDAMIDLNRDAATMQNTLARANLTLKQRALQIAEVSLTDPLTGVGNRRRLDQALMAEISRARREGETLSAIMADLDHFKRVNDEYGHGAGDKVLAHLGQLLKAQTRATDIVARFGGEEFVVLLPHTTLAQAARKAEQLRSALAAESIAPLPRAVTASFGVAELAEGEDGESLLHRVDAALYDAKEGGRNRVNVSAGQVGQ